MMHILVTGGLGAVGRPVVRWLLDRGHDCRVLDLRDEEPIAGADCHNGSIMDYPNLAKYMDGIEGVVHLAAYPAPMTAPETKLFDLNVQGTFNVFRAAADAGIQRLVCASSINALGYNYGIKFPDGQLHYFPLDEDHPTFTTDPYSFSKQVNEDTGAYFWRREGITSLFLRMPGVFDPTGSDERVARWKNFKQQSREKTAEVMHMPEPQRSRLVQEIIAEHQAIAGRRTWEFNRSEWPKTEYLSIMFGRSNFWTLLDARDVAQAAEKGLTADYEGSHAVYINDDQNSVDLPSQDLVDVWFPDVTARKKPLIGMETLVSIDRIRDLIGFEVQYPLRDWQ